MRDHPQRRLGHGVVFSLVLAITMLGCQGAKEGPPPPKPPVVHVSLPLSREITDYEDFNGQTAALNFVEVRARVTGFLKKLRFKDGANVIKGKVLCEIDPITLAANWRLADASHRQAEARLKTMTRNFDRAEDLHQRKGAISQEDYDKAVGDWKEAGAAVAVAQANREIARINLDYAQVTAPISGRISRRMVDEGNIIVADTTPITTIVDLTKIYVYFDINERSFLRIQRLIREGKIPRSQDNRTKVQVGLADEKGFSLSGTIDFEENRVDVGTGTYRVRAVVDNPDRFLSPGLFARVRLPIGLPFSAILVAEQAIVSNQDQKYVYVVVTKTDPRTKKSVEKIEYRRVETGALHDGLRVILKGVGNKDRVVVRGMQRIRPEVEVQPREEKMPEPERKAKK